MTICINPNCQSPQNSDNAQFCQNCQSSLLLKHRYRATKVLGEGGFGKTYEASDLGTPNKVIKVLINNTAKAVELFKREAEVLSQLNNYGIPKVEPNSYIVFHPAGSQEPVHCLVMEKVEGMNLRDYLKCLGNPIDSETAERWLRELVNILQDVHESGILHRDIKPQNIIFKPDGRLALIDFGAVREETGTEVTTAATSGKTEVASHILGGTSIVSKGYTSPEQISGEALQQSDFYSLGRTFIFLLTGKEPSELPYDAYNDVLQWRQYASNLETKMADLLDQMSSTLVRQRPKNADDIVQMLRENSSDTGHSDSPVQGEDIELSINVTSQEAIEGITKDISFERIVYSNGSVSSRHNESKTLAVKVPPNSKNGQRLRFAEQGNDGLHGGNSGDVYICLNISNSSSASSRWKLFQTFDKEHMAVAENPGQGVMSVAFSPDSQYFASAGADNNIKLWKFIESKFKQISSLSSHTQIVRAVVFSPDGKILASGSNDKTIKLWNYKNGNEIRTLQQHSKAVTSLAFDDSGRLMVSGSDDTLIMVKSLDEDREIQAIPIEFHSSYVQSVAFSPDGWFIASAGCDSKVYLIHFHLFLQTLIQEEEMHEGIDIDLVMAEYPALGEATSVAFSPNGKFLASGDRNGQVTIYELSLTEIELESGEKMPYFANVMGLDSIHLLNEGHGFTLFNGTQVAFSPDNSTLASSGGDKTIKIWNVKTKKLLHTLTGHKKAVPSLAFSPDGMYLVSGDASGTLMIWQKC